MSYAAENHALATESKKSKAVVRGARTTDSCIVHTARTAKVQLWTTQIDKCTHWPVANIGLRDRDDRFEFARAQRHVLLERLPCSMPANVEDVDVLAFVRRHHDY
eukprot:3011-Heterococcus_DN1.PRE.7